MRSERLVGRKILVAGASSGMGRGTAIRFAAEVVAKALQPNDVAEACLFVATLPTRAYVPELILLPSQL